MAKKLGIPRTQKNVWTINDEEWTEKWSKTPISKLYITREREQIWGSPEEPHSSLWLSALSEPMGELCRENMTVLDYGCGGCRYLNFLGKRFKRFTYYGLEKESKDNKFLQDIQKETKSHKNVHIGYIDSEVEQEAIANADVAILGSIFTHLKFNCEKGNSFSSINYKLKPILDRGGAIIFSAFIGRSEFVDGPNDMYGVPNCYGASHYTIEILKQYCDNRGLSITKHKAFKTTNDRKHRIFKIKKKP